tara:strand:+ start:3479 stop:4852 length:1374 start_codon:yes stop_codon:yes gene_type:complete
MKKVVIQGLGFVGSAMSVAVSSRIKNNKPLFKVIGIDQNNFNGNKRIDAINNGVFPFHTNDKKLLAELKKSIDRGNLIASHDTQNYSTADVIIVSINCDLAVNNNHEEINISSFIDSIGEIAEIIEEETLVIIESTIPPGTCSKLVYPLFQKIFKKRNLDINRFFLAHSYERVMPGKEYFDSIINYWRVYSGINDKSADLCRSFLSKIINIKDFPLTCLSNTTASETGKLLENSYRAVNIAFIEEWGRFAEDVEIDLYEVINSIRMRPTHSNIRQPGFGVGGYCLTKDPLFAKIAARDLFNIDGHSFPFSSKAIKVNKKMPLVTLNKLKKYFKGNLKEKNLLLMGATYRQDVGDTRFSPSEDFVKEAILMEANLKVYDPLIDYWEEIEIETEKEIPNLSNFDAVVFAVPHREFKNIDFSQLSLDIDTLIFDANNVLTNTQTNYIKKNNLNYISIGRG